MTIRPSICSHTGWYVRPVAVNRVRWLVAGERVGQVEVLSVFCVLFTWCGQALPGPSKCVRAYVCVCACRPQRVSSVLDRGSCSESPWVPIRQFYGRRSK